MWIRYIHHACHHLDDILTRLVENERKYYSAEGGKKGFGFDFDMITAFG